MKIIKTLIFTFFLFSIQSVFAQEFEVPDIKIYENPEEYQEDEADVLKCIEWLENTPIKGNEEKRKNAGAFIMVWAIGTPDYYIELNEITSELTKKNLELLYVFMGGYVKFCIENTKQKDNVFAATLSGVKSVMKVYENNLKKGIKKNKTINKLLVLSNAELEKWVRAELRNK